MTGLCRDAKLTKKVIRKNKTCMIMIDHERSLTGSSPVAFSFHFTIIIFIFISSDTPALPPPLNEASPAKPFHKTSFDQLRCDQTDICFRLWKAACHVNLNPNEDAQCLICFWIFWQITVTSWCCQIYILSPFVLLGVGHKIKCLLNLNLNKTLLLQMS